MRIRRARGAWRYHGSLLGVSQKGGQQQQQQQQSTTITFPIIVLHGGPVPHHYLSPLKQQACQGRTVIFYDQAGCGESRLPNDDGNMTVHENCPWLLDPLYYATEELPAIISQLRLDRYHVVAHSWGTIQAQLFALEHKPKGLVSLVLSGPLSDSQLWYKALWDSESGAVGQLPPFVQARIIHLDDHEMYNSPECLAIDAAVTTLSVCRTTPVPDCYTQTQQTMNKEIYVSMQGPSDFSNHDLLADFNTFMSLSRFPCCLFKGYLTRHPLWWLNRCMPNCISLRLTCCHKAVMFQQPTNPAD